MNELPRSAREFLQRARMTPPPPNGARERVRQGVERAVGSAAKPAAALKSSVKARIMTKGVARLRLVGCAMAVAGGAALLLSHSHGEPTSANPVTSSEAPVEVATAMPPPAPASAATAVADSTPTRVVSLQKDTHAPAARPQNTLHAEMVLLRDTSEAMNRGELARARTLLQQHRAQFAQGQLRAEREGLEVLARCLANEAHASERARAYLRRAPDSVLSTRIEKTCGAVDAP